MSAAAAIVRTETGITSRPAIAREIATRVVAALLIDLKRDPNDELAAAMAAVEQGWLVSPFIKLATCPEVDVASEYINRRVLRYVGRLTRNMTSQQDEVEVRIVARELANALSRRYLKQIRQADIRLN